MAVGATPRTCAPTMATGWAASAVVPAWWFPTEGARHPHPEACPCRGISGLLAAQDADDTAEGLTDSQNSTLSIAFSRSLLGRICILGRLFCLPMQ